MNQKLAYSLVFLFLSSLFTAMVPPSVSSVLSARADVHHTSSSSEPMWCGTSTTHYVELKGDRWFEIGETEYHDDVWYEYQSVGDRLRSGEARLNFDLFTGCVVAGEAYLVEWNLSSGEGVAESGEFRWVQSDELQQFRVETDTSYLEAHAVEYTFAATIQTWSKPTAAYVHGDGFTEVIEMPYPQIMNTTIDTSVCGVDHSVTAYYEVLHERVYDVGDAFNGSIQIICPVLNTDYQLFYSLCSDYCQHYFDGTILFNVTSFNDTEDYFPLLTIEPDALLNISSSWHFYADLTKRNETTGYFSDTVGVLTSMDIRDLLVVGDNFTLFEEDDPDTVPSYLDACVNTPAGQTVDERGCAFDYDAGDEDADGVLDKNDHCPDTATGVSVDASGCGANPPSDLDADGFIDRYDVFPNDPTEWEDSDGDGVGDNADLHPNDPNETLDSDGDGVGDNADVFPNDANETMDSDGDGMGDNADIFPNDANETMDSDGDGVGDNADIFPNDANETMDSDGDGLGDNADAFPDDGNETLDSDGDGVGDNADALPYDANETVDADGDGVGDNADAFPNDRNETLDSDGDGVGDNADAFPTDASQSSDADGDGFGDDPLGVRPDACIDVHGNSTIDRWGCLDLDGDGYSNADDDAPAHPNGTADAFPHDPSEWEDSDGDGFGDQQDLWPNDMYRWEDTDSDGFDDNSDVCPDEAGSSTIDQLGCPDRDGDGVSDQYDSEPDDPEVAFTSEFVRTTIAGQYDFYTRGPNGCQGYGASESGIDQSGDFLAVAYYQYESYSMKTVIKRYDRTTGTWGTLKIGGQATNDCTGNPSHPEIVVADDGQVHVLEKSGPTLKYHTWDGTIHTSHQFSGYTLGAAMAVDGDHVHITRSMEISGDRGLKYEYSNNGGSSWSSTLVRMGDFMGSAVAASGSKGYFAYSMADPEKKCVERGRPVVEGMEAEYGYYCAKDILVGGDDAGVYFRTRSNSGISAEERVTDSTQRHVFKNPKIVFDEGSSNVFILSGGVNIVKGGTDPLGNRLAPKYYPDGLYGFVKLSCIDDCSATWDSTKIAEGHAGASYDLEVTSGGIPHAVFKSTPTTARHVHLDEFGGEWVPQHLTGDIRSGIGIALHDQGPILIHTIGNELVLTAWDDDNDGLPSWKDYCPYAFGLSTDETPGCPDADGDGVTDQVEGTEDEDDDDFSLPSLGTAATLCMVVGAAVLLQRRHVDEENP